jgi:hypothetical protein
MALFQTSQEVLAHLRRVIGDRSCWVFVTDGPEGHRRLAALALALYAQWGEGRAARRLRYGTCYFQNAPTRHEALLSVLTVPKQHLPGRWVDVFLREAGLSPRRGDRDLILIPENGDTSLDGVISVFLAAVHEGAAHPDTSQDN